MEHFKTLVSSRFPSILLIAVCVLILSGCKKPVENPETLDPIYSDLLAMSTGIGGKVEGQKKKIEEMQTQIEKLQPRDPNLRRNIHQKEDLERGLVLMKQDAQYYEIRAEQRRLYDRESYLKAFNADQSWPDPEEFKDYQETKKLRLGSRAWEEKVPKDTAHNKLVEAKKKKEEKKAE